MLMNPKRLEFCFGTKAETLKRLIPLISLSHVPELFSFSVSEWKKQSEEILHKTSSVFGDNKVIVRSSTYLEDSEDIAMAGVHVSKGDVRASNRKLLEDTIKEVVSSYRVPGENNSNLKDQVLVQQMISDVSMSGVVFTQDMKTGAPYFVINYDDQTGRTDTVTSGGQYSNKTLYVHREATRDIHSTRFKALILAIQEVEKVTGHDSIDIEFAVGADNKVYLFQVRKITTHPNWNRGITLRVNDAIGRIHAFVSDRFRPIQGLFGSRSIFGQMPDWNPAEMIGITPHPLALSLYRMLITDCAWRIARKQMGYAEPKGASLMVSLSGHPYIDVRLSFHSFLPANLSSSVSNKLVDAWLDRLSRNRELHDKIEFEIAITALAFNFDESIQKQIPNVLTVEENKSFKQSLFILTNNLLTGKVASIDGELRKIEQLEKQRKCLLRDNCFPELTTVSVLLENCLWLGTIPFSILARHAFIAQSFLQSLIDRGVMDETEAFAFQSSIMTVVGDMATDIENLRTGRILPNQFMASYGHLRPGTYDILSMRYDQRVDMLDGFMRKSIKPIVRNEFTFSSKQLKEIELLLMDNGYNITLNDLFSYIKKSITAREYAKFVFTKNISDALEIIASWGEQIGLSREELSYLTIHDVLDSAVVSEGRTQEQYLREKSLAGREDNEITLALRLPHIIDNPEDVSIVPLLLSRPNFITNKTVRGFHVFINGHDDQTVDISDKIVLIEGADPGFDWIFSCSLMGLVTKYGGTNSHMAIRCVEFGLPAAIGCGEQIFDMVLRNPAVELNCAGGRIIPTEG